MARLLRWLTQYRSPIGAPGVKLLEILGTLPMSPDRTASLSHFAFMPLPNFTMIAFTNAIEVLRMANYLSGQPLYRWSVISPDGGPVTASNGLTVDTGPAECGPARHRVRVRRRRRAARDHARPSVDAAPLRARGHPARQPVHGHLCAREVGAARGLRVRDPLGEHVGAEGRVSGHALPEGTVRDRPRPHHVHGRRRAARHDAEPDRRARGHRARHADRRAVHRRTRARHERAATCHWSHASAPRTSRCSR